ncbi:MAG: hypothetical protein P1U86_21985 [Verrucomicrobiales bacterium]|nr:hypothetical protein [Verrucomicrobiales bacterium]
MNKVLIVAGERQTGERFQQAMGQEGLQTAVVWNPLQMVEFCRQHSPDFMVVDLDLSEMGLWSSIQAVRGIGTLANVPIFGLVSASSQSAIEKAKSIEMAGLFPTHEGTRKVIEAINSRIERESFPTQSTELIVGRDPSLNRLREIARDVISVTVSLKQRVAEYGEDGPELFGYIENSGIEIQKKLNGLEDFSLHDKELRHDFRNMIGSVTGFSELILMEEGLSSESTSGLTRLRQWSTEFVEILDLQKAEAGV